MYDTGGGIGLATFTKESDMAKVAILGAGIAGHTAARYLHVLLDQGHEISVISPNPKWNWIPSNILVGVGQMKEEQVTFDLAEIYRKTRIQFHQAKALSSSAVPWDPGFQAPVNL